ncbi:TIGR02234 family membrane protein [Rhodococcus sp. 15-649-2-2]|uniref:TIGR02234 family membrane protein n=1 Tax=Rhodococcus sp. 15-649-2-2 TaxID=2023140 RepID=UPI000B9A5BAD|nr:TIGR02234 family membrane protein [Rhodococcus sp. 15-649-2-2]OZE76155.1 TIGR02234 family membrane protein [Rhodococcus sp. 15-649-2-2]
MTERSGRRASAAVPVALLIVAAACLWGASRMTWVRVTSSDGLGESRTDDLLGGTWAAATTPLALVLLAAVAASFAVRGWASRVLAVLIAVVAVSAAVPAVRLLTAGASDSESAALAELPARAQVSMTEVSILPAIVTLIGALCALVAAVVSIRKTAASQVLSSKYDAPAVRRDEVARRVRSSSSDNGVQDEGEDLTERMMWDALDAGEDPTDESSTPRSS